MTIRDHYDTWRRHHSRFLKTLEGKRVILLFSGGKDSSLAMDFMTKARGEVEFDFEARAGAFPVHRYPREEQARIGAYWADRGIHVHWHVLADSDETLEQAENPCLPCQRVRKQMLKGFLADSVQDWNRLVIVTSYSLWDLVSYSVERVLGDIFASPEAGAEGRLSARFMETAQRFHPLLTMKEGYVVFRPLIALNTPDIAGMLAEAHIPSLSIPCRFGGFRPKRILEDYYSKMGLTFDYEQVFRFAGRALGMPDRSTYSTMDKDTYLRRVF